MTPYICATCGVQYAASQEAPERCLICDDERQYVGPKGQRWTTMEALCQGHHNRIRPLEPNLVGIGTVPDFAIGQRALLVRTPEGNVLWDCVSLLDDATVQAVEDAGGIAAIAISHPHFYSSMVEWSQAFHAPIYLHMADRQWVMRPDPTIIYWKGDRASLPGNLTLLHVGGHFPGSAVLHWPAGAYGKGALLVGDTLTVVADRRHVSFMYSYPNLIPLPPTEVERMATTVAPLEFDRIYGAWWEREVDEDAKNAVARSAARYVQAESAGRESHASPVAG